MTDHLLWVNTGLLAAAVILLLVYLIRSWSGSQKEVDMLVREELRAAREESARSGRELREEVAKNLNSNTQTVAGLLEQLSSLQRNQLQAVTSQLFQLTESNQQAAEKLREAVLSQLSLLLQTSEKKLEEMRRTVDEKLQVTLEHRLSESFKVVSEQLEAVHRGLGEMQTLAAGVGDLKRVLSGVKTRGTWGEIQLGAILEEILTPEQYGCNVVIKADSKEVVEFAVRLPGPEGMEGSCVWLPIDSKFPQENYLRLVEAAESGDREAVSREAKALGQVIRNAAQDICKKYLDPPRTTDFAVMFLPTEGLFAEVIRQPGLMEQLQRHYRVVPAGPTTIAALLNSLRMGFRTLAIEKRASEVWQLLAAVKTEFAKFGESLEKIREHVQKASDALEKSGKRSQAIERKLREVEKLPEEEAKKILSLGPGESEDE